MTETINKNEREAAALSLFAYHCMEAEAERFLATDVSGIEDDPKFEARVMKKVNRILHRDTRVTALKLLLVACLSALSLLFGACMCIPEVREALWDVVVDWYDDHIAVAFAAPEGDTDAPAVAQLLHAAPATIERKAIPTYLPEGYYAEEGFADETYANVNVYDPQGNKAFTITQHVIDKIEFHVDNKNTSVTQISINGYTGILVEYSNSPQKYSLTRQDEYCLYTLRGDFISVDELYKIAQNLKLQ